ncbi:prefoldin subunit 4 [Acrasis kona]|uniref:Prefoldin subunit 4 n=1 Tax=Acrasis kona TaxID=1008807 RepID=A0AAW2ZI32_9EUKA
MSHRMTKANLNPSEIEIDVTWEDQQKINTFGRLANRVVELEEEIAKAKEDKNKLTDALEEIILSDDVKYLVGEVFVDVEGDDAEKMLEDEKLNLDKQVSIKEAELKKIQDTSKQLKAALYLKFGKNINLD